MWRVGLIAIVFLVGACGGGDKDSAGDALRKLTDYADKGQWGRMWDTLHPDQQKLVPRELFTECRSKTFNGARFRDVKVIETYEEDTDLPGVSQHVSSTAVTYEAKIGRGDNPSASRQTSHQYRVGDTWRWALTQREITAYQKGQCPES
jgi:hypothetical protein